MLEIHYPFLWIMYFFISAIMQKTAMQALAMKHKCKKEGFLYAGQSTTSKH